MIDLELDPRSVDSTIDYVDQMRQRILQGVRVGMNDAMQALAWNVVDKLQGSPIQSRSGKLMGGILGSPRVTENADYVRGSVAGRSSDGKPIGLWLEEGTHVPAVEGKLFAFTTPDGNTVFTRGHRAFDVKPHPFLNSSLDAMRQPIMDIIAARVREATAA